jgi:hypothetical protein
MYTLSLHDALPISIISPAIYRNRKRICRNRQLHLTKMPSQKIYVLKVRQEIRKRRKVRQLILPSLLSQIELIMINILPKRRNARLHPRALLTYSSSPRPLPVQPSHLLSSSSNYEVRRNSSTYPLERSHFVGSGTHSMIGCDILRVKICSSSLFRNTQ